MCDQFFCLHSVVQGFMSKVHSSWLPKTEQSAGTACLHEASSAPGTWPCPGSPCTGFMLLSLAEHKVSQGEQLPSIRQKSLLVRKQAKSVPKIRVSSACVPECVSAKPFGKQDTKKGYLSPYFWGGRYPEKSQPWLGGRQPNSSAVCPGQAFFRKD